MAQREISHFISLVKAIALINAPFRLVNGRVVATRKDVDEVMKLWTPISVSMSYGISPQALSFYKDVILPAYYAKKDSIINSTGITLSDISKEYYNQIGNYPNMENIRKQYIPVLETASLIKCEKSKDDKRNKIVIPLVFFDN